jgi:hypothetical protein
MREKPRKWDWVALMVDVDPADLKNCVCGFPALFWVNPNDYRAGDRVASQRYLRIQGKHRNWESARRAIENAIALRH